MTRISVGDIELYYETVGEGDPILFIHGLGSSSRDWELQTGYFAQQYQVVTVDIRGHGRSDKPSGRYSVPLFARDVTALIQALGVTPVHVVGISMGGMIGLQLAVDAPDLVKSLVVVNAGPDLRVRTLRDRLQVFQRFAIVWLLGMRKMGEVLGGRLFPKPGQEEIRRLFAERWAENDPRAYRAAMRSLVGWSVNDRLGEVACPTLFVAADQDYAPVAVKAAAAARMQRAAVVVIEDSRHATPVDQPEAFNQAVCQFLEKQRTPGPSNG
jgi:pimeloyl-ACP methyl ester carboxylesterase